MRTVALIVLMVTHTIAISDNQKSEIIDQNYYLNKIKDYRKLGLIDERVNKSSFFTSPVLIAILAEVTSYFLIVYNVVKSEISPIRSNAKAQMDAQVQSTNVNSNISKFLFVKNNYPDEFSVDISEDFTVGGIASSSCFSKHSSYSRSSLDVDLNNISNELRKMYGESISFKEGPNKYIESIGRLMDEGVGDVFDGSYGVSNYSTKALAIQHFVNPRMIDLSDSDPGMKINADKYSKYLRYKNIVELISDVVHSQASAAFTNGSNSIQLQNQKDNVSQWSSSANISSNLKLSSGAYKELNESISYLIRKSLDNNQISQNQTKLLTVMASSATDVMGDKL